MNRPSVDEYFAEILSEKLSDADVQQLFTLHGEAEFPNSLNNIESEEKLVIKFNSRNKLMRTMATIHAKLDEIKKDIVLINDLPDDCLAHIFSFLSVSENLNIERVCKRWRKLSEKGWHYTSDISLPGKFSKNQLDVIFKRCGRFLRELYITIEPDCIDCLPLIIEFCQLDRLELISLTLRETSDILSTQHCANLTELFKKTRELRSVRIEGNLNCYDIEYSNILASQNLKTLMIFHSHYELFDLPINLHDFPNLNEVSLARVVINVEDAETYGNWTALETLTLARCKFSTQFSTSLKSFVNLETLSLHDNIGMTREDVLGIAKNCKRLTTVEVLGCEWIEDCFKDLAKIPSLTSLGINQFDLTDDGMGIQHLTNVEDLEIYSYLYAMQTYESLLHLITHSERLKTLYLHVDDVDASLRARITNIFEQGLRKIPLHLTFETNPYTPVSVPTYNGPKHPLLKVEVICWTVCAPQGGSTVRIGHDVESEDDEIPFSPQ